MSANWPGLIQEISVVVLDNPLWSASIVAGVVLVVVFALPEPRDAGRRPARRDDEHADRR